MSKKIWGLALAGVCLAYLVSGFYQVGTDERGVVRRFGKVVRAMILPGLHYHFPYPFEKVDTPSATEIKKVNIGFSIVDLITGEKPPADQLHRLTGDTNIINVQMMIHYVITEPALYLFKCEQPEQLVRNSTESVLTRLLSEKDVDWVLTTGRTEIQAETQKRVQELLDIYQTGIRVTLANLLSVEPPEETIEAFKDVSSAKADREQMINKAHSVANDIVPKAKGEAEQILRNAESLKIEQVAKARAEVAAFLALNKEYQKYPQITAFRLYQNTMQQVLARARLIAPPLSDQVSLNLFPNGTVSDNPSQPTDSKAGQK